MGWSSKRIGWSFIRIGWLFAIFGLLFRIVSLVLKDQWLDEVMILRAFPPALKKKKKVQDQAPVDEEEV